METTVDKKAPKLPQSLLDAAKRGEEIAKKPVSPEVRELRKRIERNLEEFHKQIKDPAFRARFSEIIKALHEDFVEEQRIMSQLEPIPQHYWVRKDLVHKTDERLIQKRRTLYPEKTQIRYTAGSTITLRSVFVQVDSEGRHGELHTTSLWVWVDSDGWIIRPGVLRQYINKEQLRKM